MDRVKREDVEVMTRQLRREMMKDHRKCSNCRFVRAHVRVDGTNWSECIKNAPIASPENGVAWWPSVKPDDQCWEWEVEEGRLESNVEAEYYRTKQLAGPG